MLVSRNLDDQTYAEITAEAENRLPGLCPDWTNYNPADPGIAMIELMAWYKEMQQYRLNLCTEEMKRRMLKALGVYPEPPKAACCMLEISEECGAYPAMTPLTTEDGQSFELDEAVPAGRAEITGVFARNDNGSRDLLPLMLRRDAEVQVFSFADEARTDLVLRFRPNGSSEAAFWFEAAEKGDPVRAPFEDGSPMPRTIRWELEGFGTLEPSADETHAFANSGHVVFELPKGAEKHRELTLCAVLADAGCEEEAQLLTVTGRRFRAVQRETRAALRYFTMSRTGNSEFVLEDALGQRAVLLVFGRSEEGWEPIEVKEQRNAAKRSFFPKLSDAAEDGAPNVCAVLIDPDWYERLLFPSSGLPCASIHIETEGKTVLTDCLRLICDTRMPDGSIRPTVWHCVENLCGCGPQDRVFVWDAAREEVHFGDGRNGAVVPAGENAVLIARLVLSDAEGGNISAGGAMRFPDGISVPYGRGFGGRAGETVSEAAARFRRELLTPAICVTAEDYENTAMKTPGLRVASAHAIPGLDLRNRSAVSSHPSVTVVCASAGPRSKPDEAFLEAVRRHLEKHRRVGVSVYVTGPRETAIAASMRLRTDGSVSETDVEEALRSCFTLRPNGRRIGDVVDLQQAGKLLQSIPGVLSVEYLSLRAADSSAGISGIGDIILPEDGIPFLASCNAEII